MIADVAEHFRRWRKESELIDVEDMKALASALPSSVRLKWTLALKSSPDSSSFPPNYAPTVAFGAQHISRVPEIATRPLLCTT